MNRNIIQLKLVKSGLDTVKDDCTAIVIANGSVGKEDLFASAARLQPHLDADVACQAFDQKWLEIFAQLGEGRHVTCDGIGYSLDVEGSYLHADDEIDASDLSVAVTVYDERYAAALAGLTVVTTVDEESLPFVAEKVQNGSAFGRLTAGAPGKVMGRRLSCGLAGERLVLEDCRGTSFEIADAVAGREGLSLAFTAPAAAKPGKGELAVWCRGLLTPEAEPTRQTLKVTVVEDESAPKPLAVSQDGTVKIMSVDEIHSDEPFMIGGTNLGFDGEANRGIMGALATVNGVSLDWYCGGEEEGSANQSFSPSAPFPPELASGTYRAAVTFNLSGHGEDLEPLVVEGVKIVVP